MLSPSGLQQRAQLLQAIRSFFIERAYLEVDTPIRLPVLVPEAHIQPFSSEEMFLQTSPELCMKMLLARGCTQLFQLCHCFRKEENGRLHQTEFTLLEWYHCGWDYKDLMNECEHFFSYLVNQLQGYEGISEEGGIRYRGKTISLSPPWQRLSVSEAFHQYAGIAPEEALAQGCFDQVLVESVEPNLGWQTPVFLYDYPVALASLAKPKKNNQHLAERFELYLGGLELANGFSELVDPDVQRQRFVEELAAIASQGKKAVMPERFLFELGKLGETTGIALGVDRLAMLLMGQEKLLDVLPFSLDSLCP